MASTQQGRAGADGAEESPAADHELLAIDQANINAMAEEIRGAIDATQGGSSTVGSLLDISKLQNSLARGIEGKYKSFVESLRENSPRILLVGDSSLGKSSLVNVVFGFHPGRDGARVQAGGRPCTQSFTEFGPTDLAPVRIIDSKGVEKLSGKEQMEEIRSYISKQKETKSSTDHIHLCWYFVGERWQKGDVTIVTELQSFCGVVLVINKRDQKTKAAVANLRAAIVEDLPGIAIVEAGDPRGTWNWIPGTCSKNHGEDFIIPNMRAKTWQCGYQTGTLLDSGDPIFCGSGGDDSPFGHRELVPLSLALLPELCRPSFEAAQRVDMSAKHKKAAAYVLGFAASAGAIGATPIPFADLPLLMALEVVMSATLLAVYGVPLDYFGKAKLGALQTGAVSTGGMLACGVAQILKGIPGLGLVGAGIDCVVAATAVATLGTAMSVGLTWAISAGAVNDPSRTDETLRKIGLISSTLEISSTALSMASPAGRAAGKRTAAERTLVSRIEDLSSECARGGHN